jgi:hypothetical protein
VRLALLALALAACLPESRFPCERDEQCDAPGRIGHCEADGLCSFDDDACESGRRYGELAGTASGTCTVPEMRPLRAACVAGELAPTRDAPCADEVCAVAGACCEAIWSEACVHLADTLCDARCGATIAVAGAATSVLVYDAGWTVSDEIALASTRVAWLDASDGAPRLVAADGAIVRALAADLSAPAWEHALEAGAAAQSLAAADVDRDGVVEIAVAATGGADPRLLYLLVVDGADVAASEALSQERPGGVALAPADYTGDGVPDLVVVGTTNYRAYYYSRTDRRFAQGFTSGGGTPDNPSAYLDAGWGDVDGDGILDLVVAGTQLRLHLGDGDAVAQVPDWTRRPPTGAVYAGAVGDLDGDGRADVLGAISPHTVGDAVPPEGRLDLWWGWDDGKLTQYQRAAPRFEQVRLADVDGDARLDVLGVVEGGGAVWLRNTGAVGAPALADPEAIAGAEAARWIDPTGPLP